MRTRIQRELLLRGEVERECCPLAPVRRNLQDGGTAEAAVGNEHVLVEAATSNGGDDASRDSGEIAEALLIGLKKHERHERGARLDDLESEVAGEVVAEAGGAHLWDGQASRSNDECGSAELAAMGQHVEGVVAADFGDVGVAEEGDAGFCGFGEQHVEDVAGGAVTEELSELLFVPRN